MQSAGSETRLVKMLNTANPYLKSLFLVCEAGCKANVGESDSISVSHSSRADYENLIHMASYGEKMIGTCLGDDIFERDDPPDGGTASLLKAYAQ
jgi:hypothetical protein